MAATREDIREWFLRGKKQKATHMIVVCDTYDWEDYPFYVSRDENVREKFEELNEKGMNKVMEVYSMNIDLSSQLDEHRAFHFD